MMEPSRLSPQGQYTQIPIVSVDKQKREVKKNTPPHPPLIFSQLATTVAEENKLKMLRREVTSKEPYEIVREHLEGVVALGITTRERAFSNVLKQALIDKSESFILDILEKETWLKYDTPIISKKEEKSLLHLVCQQGLMRVFEKLTNHNSINVDIVDSRGLTPLHDACRVKQNEIACLLIKLSDDLNVQCNKGNTALHYATSNNLTQLVLFLLSSGANPNVLNNNFQLPMDLTLKYKNKKLIEGFLEYGGEISGSEGLTLEEENFLKSIPLKPNLHLFFIMEFFPNELMEMVTEDKINCVNTLGDTLLHKMIEKKKYKEAFELIDWGASPLLENFAKESPVGLLIQIGLSDSNVASLIKKREFFVQYVFTWLNGAMGDCFLQQNKEKIDLLVMSRIIAFLGLLSKKNRERLPNPLIRLIGSVYTDLLDELKLKVRLCGNRGETCNGLKNYPNDLIYKLLKQMYLLNFGPFKPIYEKLRIVNNEIFSQVIENNRALKWSGNQFEIYLSNALPFKDKQNYLKEAKGIHFLFDSAHYASLQENSYFNEKHWNAIAESYDISPQTCQKQVLVLYNNLVKENAAFSEPKCQPLLKTALTELVAKFSSERRYPKEYPEKNPIIEIHRKFMERVLLDHLDFKLTSTKQIGQIFKPKKEWRKKENSAKSS